MSSTPTQPTPAASQSKGETSFAQVKESLRKLPGMSPNATCTILNRQRDLLIICGPLDREAAFDAIAEAADQILDAAGCNNAIRAFQDLRGTHLVIDANYQE